MRRQESNEGEAKAAKALLSQETTAKQRKDKLRHERGVRRAPNSAQAYCLLGSVLWPTS